MGLKAVIFDFDGTLTKQGSINFKDIKKKIGCPDNQYILKFIETLDDNEKKIAGDTLDHIEFDAATISVEEDYVTDIFDFLSERSLPIIVITRNSRKSVLRSLKNFKHVNVNSFYRIISRDDPYPVKPDPSSILQTAKDLSISPEEMILIGDYIHDISAGINSGCKTVYKITGRKNDHLVKSDYTIRSLKELIPIFLTLLPGKKRDPQVIY